MQPSTMRLSLGRAWAQTKRAPDSRFNLETPAAVAAIRGTDWELDVDASAKTLLAVFSEQVEFSNAKGSVTLASNAAALAEVGRAPVKILLSNPRDCIRWVNALKADPLRVRGWHRACLFHRRQSPVDLKPLGQCALCGAELQQRPCRCRTLLLPGLPILSYGLFLHQKIWLPPLFPMAAVPALYGSTVLLGLIASRRHALQTKMMFSQYVPQEVVARLVARPELLRLGGEVRELTLMFTDLANFTTLSEHLTAEATVDVLTKYFNTMTPVIHRHGVTVDKFIGDAVMAFWGAPLDDPRHAEHAVRAAIEMQEATQALVERLTKRGLPPTGMRFGLHTGRVVVGNVGSHSRFSYAVIDDAANLAARLEGANKAFGTRILLSGATADLLPVDLSLRHVDTVIVKGKSEAVKVFRPCLDAEICALSAVAMAIFYARQRDSSESALRRLLVRQPDDLAALRFLQRVADERASPPKAG